MSDRKDEAQLEQPLLEWLQRCRRLRGDTIVIHEFPWFGRRVDIATLNRSGCTVAYELKVRNSRRAVQQASYNRLAFDRSYVVTASEPSALNQRHAEEAGVGVIVLRNCDARVVIESSNRAVARSLRRRLVESIRSRVDNRV
jgi:hypothetical protein